MVDLIIAGCGGTGLIDSMTGDYPVVGFRPVRRDVLGVVVHMVQCAARDCVFGIEA